MREQEAIAHCQHALFKFNKHKERYKDKKRGVSSRYPLEIGSFLWSEGRDPSESSAASATVDETFLNTPSSDVVPLTTSSLPTASDTGRMTRAYPEEAALSASAFEASYKGKVSV